MTDTKIRESICKFGQSIYDRGLTPGSSGNITVRLDDGGFLSTPTNCCLGMLDPISLSRLDKNWRLISGDKPTKEVPLHAAMYDTREASGAIVHLHSTHAVAVSMLPDVDPADALPPLTAYYVMKVGKAVLLPYHSPGDPAVGDAIRGLAGRYSSVLLSNHGPVVAGDTIEKAVWAIEELEETAKLHLLLKGLTPRLLTSEQVDELSAQSDR